MKDYITKDSGERVLYDSGFNRDVNTGKPRYDLIPHELLYRLAMLYTRGAEKYGDDNWQKACTQEEYDRFMQSAFRHFMQWRAGEDDEDHAAAAIWNIMAYEWHVEHKPDMTDEQALDAIDQLCEMLMDEDSVEWDDDVGWSAAWIHKNKE